MVLFLSNLLIVAVGFLLRSALSRSTRPLAPIYLWIAIGFLALGVAVLLPDEGTIANVGSLLLGVYLASRVGGTPLWRRRVRSGVFGYALLILAVLIQVIH